MTESTSASDEGGAELRLPPFLSRLCDASEMSVTGFSIIGSGFFAVASLVDPGGIQKTLGAAGLVIVVAVALVMFLRGWYQKQVKDIANQIIEKQDAEDAQVMTNQAAMLAHLVSASETSSAPAKEKSVEKSRVVILAIGASILGNSSTRITLFRAVENGSSLCFEPEDLGHGRTEPSTRIFREGDPTYEEAIAGRIRFVKDCKHEDGDRGRVYRTYMNAPIVNSNGGIYGIIAVDRKNPGDFVQARDEPTLLYLAKLLALNFSMDRKFSPVESYYTGRGGIS